MTPWWRRPRRAEPASPAGPELVVVERALADLSEWVAYPATPDLAAAVRERLTAAPAGAAPATAAKNGRPAPSDRRIPERSAPDRPTFGRRRPPLTAGRPRLVLAAAVVTVLALLVTVLPGPRAAVARLWDLVGVRITREPIPPDLGPAPTTRPGQRPGVNLFLGEPVTLAEASARAGAALGGPAGLGEPDGVWYQSLGAPDGRRWAVSMVFHPRPGLPASPYLREGMLLTVIQDTDAAPLTFLKKVPDREGGATVRVFTRDSRTWYWVSGPPHAVFTAYPGLREGRQAGNTLLWSSGGRTYRLEAEVPLETALAMADSVPGG